MKAGFLAQSKGSSGGAAVPPLPHKGSPAPPSHTQGACSLDDIDDSDDEEEEEQLLGHRQQPPEEGGVPAARSPPAQLCKRERPAASQRELAKQLSEQKRWGAARELLEQLVERAARCGGDALHPDAEHPHTHFFLGAALSQLQVTPHACALATCPSLGAFQRPPLRPSLVGWWAGRRTWREPSVTTSVLLRCSRS